MRTNIEIDDELVDQAMRRYGLRTKREAVDLALRHLVGEPLTTAEALDFRDPAGRPTSTSSGRLEPLPIRDPGGHVRLVEYLRGTETLVHQSLRAMMGGASRWRTTEVVVMEVLAGARDQGHLERLRRLLLRCQLLPREGSVSTNRRQRSTDTVGEMARRSGHSRTASLPPWPCARVPGSSTRTRTSKRSPGTPRSASRRNQHLPAR